MATVSLFEESEFTHDAYRNLLLELRERYTPRPFGVNPSTGDLLLRHNITLSLDDAVSMARAESDLGVTGTYCVLLTSPLFNPLDDEQAAKIRRIEEYGHEVGLQLDPETTWETRPTDAEIEQTVADQLGVLETITTDPSPVVSFHRPPAWLFGREFSGFDSALAPIESVDIPFVTDVPAVRTDGAATLETFPESLHLLVHPEQWNAHHDDHERTVERCVIDACRYVNRRARSDFVDPLRRS